MLERGDSLVRGLELRALTLDLRFYLRDLGFERDIFTVECDYAVVKVNLANLTRSQIKIRVCVTNFVNDFYLVKNAPIPASSTLQVLDGGNKIILQSGDAIKNNLSHNQLC